MAIRSVNTGDIPDSLKLAVNRRVIINSEVRANNPGTPTTEQSYLAALLVTARDNVVSVLGAPTEAVEVGQGGFHTSVSEAIGGGQLIDLAHTPHT